MVNHEQFWWNNHIPDMCICSFECLLQWLNMPLSKVAGLKITASQRTMSVQNDNLSEQSSSCMVGYFDCLCALFWQILNKLLIDHIIMSCTKMQHWKFCSFETSQPLDCPTRPSHATAPHDRPTIFGPVRNKT